MCEFCAEHGEGKKLYLQMKNYSDELLPLDRARREQYSEIRLVNGSRTA